MENEEKLVTKEFLTAFGDKCKRMFRLNPVHSYNSQDTTWIKINTSLIYNDQINGFDDLYINIQGITSESENDVKKVINSNFYVKTNYSKLIYFAQGVNLGTEDIEAVVFVKDADNKLNIYLHLPESRYPKDLIVDIIGHLNDNLLLKIVTDITYVQTLSEPNTYEQIATSTSTLPFSKELIGSIVTQLQESTQFTIVEDQSIIGGTTVITSSKSYPEDSIFSKIFEAAQANKLSHGLTFQYDWDNPISQSDSAVNITNGEFASGNVVKIPVPNLLQNGITTEPGVWLRKVKVVNGIIIEGDSSSSIDHATTTNLGGIKLLTNETTSVGDKIPVQLDAYHKAFVDKNYFEEDKHRDDLSKSIYHDNISLYGNLIWQHIGETDDLFVNGYFYKCAKTNFTVQYDTSNSPYSIGTQIGTKLEDYIYDTGSTLDLNKRFKLYVDTYPTTKIVEPGSEIQYVKISELDEFKLSNIDNSGTLIGEVLVMTKSQLSEILDITIKDFDGWNTKLTKDYPKSIMDLPFTLSASGYTWKQWDVQPRIIGSGSDFEIISNQEIDYLFLTHVNILDLSYTTYECNPGDVFDLIVTVLPNDASIKTVNWKSSSPKVSVTKIDINQAKVIVASDAEPGEYIVTVISDSEPDITDTCTITVN